MIKVWQENEHEEVDSDSIRCLSLVSMSDVAETSQRMLGHTPTEQLSGTLFQKTRQGNLQKWPVW